MLRFGKKWISARHIVRNIVYGKRLEVVTSDIAERGFLIYGSGWVGSANNVEKLDYDTEEDAVKAAEWIATYVNHVTIPQSVSALTSTRDGR
jgi:hypothetical protein